jgi:hypothetical protein
VRVAAAREALDNVHESPQAVSGMRRDANCPNFLAILPQVQKGGRLSLKCGAQDTSNLGLVRWNKVPAIQLGCFQWPMNLIISENRRWRGGAPKTAHFFKNRPKVVISTQKKERKKLSPLQRVTFSYKGQNDAKMRL